MLRKQVTVSKVGTLSDGTIRIQIDLLNGNAEDIAAAFSLREIDTTMILVPTMDLNDAEAH